MNITVLALLGFLLISGLSFAAEPAAKTAKTTHAAHMGHVVSGTIDSVSLAAAGQKKSELSVKQDGGDVMKFTLSSPSILDASGKSVALDKLKAGEKVKIHYSKAKDGERIVKSITLS